MNVTDRQTPHDGIGCAYAKHRAAKMQPNPGNKWLLQAV